MAAASSLVAFALGAVLPIAPYFAGARSLFLPLIVFGFALFAGGATVGRLTKRPPLTSGARQFILGAVAAAVIFGIGQLIGVAHT